MADELDDAGKWLRAKIVAAVGHGRVYQDRAKRGSVFPYVLFNFVPGQGDTQGQGKRRIMSRPRFDVRVVTQGAPTDESEAMVTAIDSALEGATTETHGDFRISSRREREIRYTSPGATSDEFFTYRGGTYQLWVAHNA